VKIRKFLKIFYQSAQIVGGGVLRNGSSGSILVEFSVSIPVLVLVLYASIDITKYYLTCFKLENSARYAANLLINSIEIDGTSETTGIIATKKFKYISHAAFYNIYVGNQNMTSAPLGHNGILSICLESTDGAVVKFHKRSAVNDDAPADRAIEDKLSEDENNEPLPENFNIIVEAGIEKSSSNSGNILGFFVLPVSNTIKFMRETITLPTPLDNMSMRGKYEETIIQSNKPIDES
jgi:hypothetical protein